MGLFTAMAHGCRLCPLSLGLDALVLELGVLVLGTRCSVPTGTSPCKMDTQDKHSQLSLAVKLQRNDRVFLCHSYPCATTLIVVMMMMMMIMMHQYDT